MSVVIEIDMPEKDLIVFDRDTPLADLVPDPREWVVTEQKDGTNVALRWRRLNPVNE